MFLGNKEWDTNHFIDSIMNYNSEIVIMDKQTFNILSLIIAELERADKKYAHEPMTHMKVGLKTIECEFKELEREVERATYEVAQPEWMKKEAVQVAAMSIKFIRDICK